ncbi:MAG: FKBP-type peptidyl-prolyl cis-trans isomerase [Crocinitomicaceae bacterium]
MSKIKDEASYGVGMSIGQSLANQDLDDLNLDQFLKGVQDILSEKDPKFSPEEANEKIQHYLEEIKISRFEKFKKEGEVFLKANAKKESITELPSGLQYEILKEGSGPQPKADSQVTVHYHGTLTNGEIFDSSINRGTPATFGVNQVIKGWTEALQLMKEGAKWRLYIPQDLAYGANPHPSGPIKPYMALIFDVELINVN